MTEPIIEAVFTVDPADADAVTEVLYELSPGGFRDGKDVEAADLVSDDFNGNTRSGADDTHEFGVYTSVDTASQIVAEISARNVRLIDMEIREVPSDWNDRWQAFHNAIQIGGLWVGPPWQEDTAPTGMPRVVIEPGQGFGTGAHPTTRLVLELLSKLPRASLLDVGTGSGVLAIAAHRLGFAPITAIDIDEAAVENANTNFVRNDCAQSITARTVDAATGPLPKAAIVLANMTLEPLRLLAPRLRCGLVIASGILRSQAQAAEAVFAESGFVVRQRADRDGWVAYVFESADADRAVGSRWV
jgi:ribosomal protein L11 methyltransferase